MTHKLVPQKTWLACAVILWLAAACSLPSNPGPTVTAAALEPTPTVTESPAPTPTALPILPQPLYYLSGRSGSQQVWRLERDGLTQTQITSEGSDVISFDISPADGSVAYVSANQLYLAAADGSNRRLLVDNAAADAQAADYYTTQQLSDVHFSSDGRILAYAFNGLWVADLVTFQANHVLANQVQTRENGNIVLKNYYAPLLWAPEDQLVLITTGNAQSSALAILELAAEPRVIKLETNLACCHAAWAPDGSSLLVADPFIGLVEPGLWRYAAATGEQTALFATEDNGVLHFAGWPLQLADGSLYYFYATAAEAPEGDVPLYMVRSAVDGVNGRTQLRPEAFSNLTEALWAEDGSLALLVQARPDGGSGGSVLLAAANGSQLQLLLEDGHRLTWGQ